MIIEDNGITIKNLELQNINNNYLGWFKDEDVKRFIVKSKVYNIDDLKRYYFENRLKKNNLLLGIFDKKINHIGNIKVQFSDNSKKACTIGILIGHKEYRNKGIGSKSLELVIEKLSKFYNTKTFKLGVNHKNLIAIGSYKKAVFIRT